MPDAQFDVLVWGATSSVGKLVAEYLVRHYGVGKGLRWALGGRSAEKLGAVRDTLAKIDPAAARLPIVLGDSRDPNALDRVVPQTRVVATTVGPYAIYGRELVAACVRHGVDYCDLTGEVLFIRAMIDEHHARARESGARIVHCCGFDSIPSDLGTLMLQEFLREKTGAPCHRIKFFLTAAKGGLGGGTVASALHQAEEMSKNPTARRILGDPYSLDPGRSERGPDGPERFRAHWDPDLPGWTGPFVMAMVNTRIVRRSNALMNYAYGKDFRYSEVTGLKPGVTNWLKAQTLAAGMGAFLGAMMFAPARRLTAKLAPPPGQGPSEQTRESGYFTVKLVGFGPGGIKVVGTVKGKSDPGHGETAKMFAESAVWLARHPIASKQQGGVLTPASAMGMSLVERLREAGMVFEVGVA